MARKIYLVDTENVGCSWRHLLENVSTNDKLILFYTEKSPNLSYVDLAYIQTYCDRFTMEKCYVGKNALDFQLVSYMGYQMKSSPKTQFVIVSNDNGFDSVIQYWKDKDREVLRMTTRDLETLSVKKKELAKSKQVKEKRAVEQPVEEKQVVVPRTQGEPEQEELTANQLVAEMQVAEKPVADKLVVKAPVAVNQVVKQQVEDPITEELKHSYSKDQIKVVLKIVDKFSIKEYQAIYQEIVKKYGKDKGVVLYRLLKPLLKSYYS